MNSKEIIKQNSFRAAVAMSILLSSISSTAFASTISGDRVSGIEWPWMKFLNSLAAISLFAGHAGGSTQKFILLILVISICLFAPNFMTFLQSSAGGLTISGAM